ncbi:hypothetical protein [Marinibacterium profundimaris]|uniref:Uncharacterized protein n=1 Tax=Marinibacterium profundimaris TaxID=1679460 RepID=A0A225NXI2_9RHOB|nr:hypothetical protein [Marinibacterium profundimaris]OWU77888.1 hypothetical protein ATO3_04445 [Marinibacterium profundimaris]
MQSFLTDRIIPAGTGAILTSLMLAGPALAQDTEIADIDKHFDVASEYFGDGKVQLSSRQDTDAGPQYAVHQFDCVNKTFTTPFEGTVAPDAFPVPVTEQQEATFEQGDPVAPLAQHACAKHGHPLLEW